MCKKDESGYLRSISADVNDISIALINTICENEERLLSADRIVVCHTPPPSFIAANKDNLLGIVTSDNEPQSHAAELAASFNIPYIASDNELSHIIDEENALINSDKGYLYLNPDLSTLTKFSDLDRQKRNEKEKEDELSTMPLLTRDGKQIFVYAELKRPHELTPFSERYCDGIGSLSNEDYYLESAYPPDEEELFEEYRRAAEIMPTKPIIIKAFKGAGSVHLNSIVNENGETPGGELYVLCDGAFRIQLRAVMRAAVYGSLHFLIQCTEKYSDLSQCAQMMEELSAELYEEDREFTPVPFGIIIDTIPSALMCERLIDECDFFVVDREKLSKALFTETPDEILFDKDDIYLDALEHLMTSVAKAAAKKKKRAILSLGKCSFAESISLDVINEFSSVSASLDKIYALKKKIIEM